MIACYKVTHYEALGLALTLALGDADGDAEGDGLSLADGDALVELLGLPETLEDGLADGLNDGESDGLALGDCEELGDALGEENSMSGLRAKKPIYQQ